MDTDPALLHALVDPVREAVAEARAVMGTVFLADEEATELRVVIIGGWPPTIFILPERIPLDPASPPFVGAAAWRDGRMYTAGDDGGESETAATRPLRTALIPCAWPYVVTAVPIPPDGEGHRWGVLTLVRLPHREGPLTTPMQQHLLDTGHAVARRLEDLARDGVNTSPGLRPAMFPILHETYSRWGVHEVPGSAGLTMMSRVIPELFRVLGSARSMEGLVESTARRIVQPLGGHGFALGTVHGQQIQIVGHSSMSPRLISWLHGSALLTRSRAARSLNHGEPLLYGDSRAFRAAHPDAPEPESGEACAILPLLAGRRLVGVLVCIFTTGRWEPEEQGLMMIMAGSLGETLERIRLSSADHALAAGVQQWLLPRMLPDLPGVTRSARYLPATGTSGVGGDWYDIVPLGEGRIALVVGDVEGHSVESAVVMGQVRSAVRAYLTEGHGPAAVLARADTFLAQQSELLATCCVALLDAGTGTLSVALAGHPAPVVRLPDAAVTALDGAVGVPLGGVPTREEYQALDTRLPPGALLFCYTDGITQQDDPVSAARDLLTSCAGESADGLDDLADRLSAAVPDDHRDDVVLLVARYDGAGPGVRSRVRTIELQRRDLGGVALARTFVHLCLLDWDLGDISTEMVLATSEIVTNALVHADTNVEIRLREYPDRVRLEVADADVRPPVPSALSVTEGELASAEHGRGLVIVGAVTEDWGTSPAGRGKTVWCEFPRP